MTQNSSDLRTEQLAPHSIEAEEAVLGSILRNPEVLEEVRFLKEDDFFIVRHQWIYEAMKAIASRVPQENIDFLTVVHELEAKNRLVETGGAAYILGLIGKTMTSWGSDSYARIVERTATRRRLIDAASQIARLAHSDETDIDKVLTQSEFLIRQPADSHAKTVDTSKSISDISLTVLETARLYRAEPAEVRGMTCGIRPLDQTIRGFVRGRFYLFAGRPAMGKSSLLAQVAVGLALQGYGVLLFSLEMTEHDMVWRMACQLARVDSTALECGTLSAADFKRFEDAITKLQALPIWIEDRAGLTVSSMRSIAYRYQVEHGVAVVMVDTINRVGDVSMRGDQYQGMTYASHNMADWAHGSDYAVIAAVQLNRATTSASDKKPRLEHFRDSGALEEDTDYAGAIHRPFYYEPDKPDLEHLAQFYTLKHRHGPSDRACELYYEASWPGFGELTKTTLNPDKALDRPVNTLEKAKQRIKRKEAAGLVPPADDGFILTEEDEISAARKAQEAL